MRRIDVLKKEMAEIKEMRCLAYGLKDNCIAWYKNEIDVIENYGGSNPEVKEPIEIKIDGYSAKERAEIAANTKCQGDSE